MTTAVCRACGRHLDAGFRFCDACAAPVAEQPAARRGDSPLLPYRPELDGIRALAVLGVMFSHTAILLGIENRARWLAAMALGVDAFFVLSGYLITTLLLREIRATDRVDLKAFYARRILRLIPALLLLILIVGAISWTWEGFNSSGLPYAVLSALVLLYVGNWFIPFLGPNLLSHTWSLALEEQYYIIWPSVLVHGLRRGKSWRFLAWSCVGAAVFVVVLRFVADPFVPVGEGPDRLSISFTWTVMRADGVLIGSALGLALDA
ncbi:MAG TPA: acyltransferase, partial [Actinomycetota bacterium]|nr:acyltransferase [Actinomycetota bacterium]